MYSADSDGVDVDDDDNVVADVVVVVVVVVVDDDDDDDVDIVTCEPYTWGRQLSRCCT